MSNTDSGEILIMDKESIRQEMLYQMSIQPLNAILEKQIITKAEFNKMKSFLIAKYNPIIAKLLGL